jgi:hypothetical protein
VLAADEWLKTGVLQPFKKKKTLENLRIFLVIL